MSHLYRMVIVAGALLLSACASPRVVDYPSANQDGRVRFLVIHFTDEDFPRSLEILTKPGKNPVSAHYLVSRAGEFHGFFHCQFRNINCRFHASKIL